jgi:hypothetical protein
MSKATEPETIGSGSGEPATKAASRFGRVLGDILTGLLGVVRLDSANALIAYSSSSRCLPFK